MNPAPALLTLVHLLVLVYWLGGDLGAFYGASFLVDPGRSTNERIMALKILNAVDMAPRSALILALPSGLALAWSKDWVALPGYVPLLLGIASAAWLGLAWAVHLAHGDARGLARLDIAIRWVMLAMLLGTGIAGVGKVIGLPLFIALKLIVLGCCIGLGLVVRRQLVPLSAPIRAMIATGPTPAGDAAIAQVIARTRPVIVLLWLLLLVAAYLGIATPL